MKKIFAIFFCFVLVLGFAGCGRAQPNGTPTSSVRDSSEIAQELEGTPAQPTHTNPPEDRYTKYVKDYVGRNASDVGTLRLSGKYMDSYGAANILIVFITENGEAVTEDNIANYRVTSQNPAPGTEINIVFETDENGEEYEYSTESVSLNEIVLHVEKITND